MQDIEEGRDIVKTIAELEAKGHYIAASMPKNR